MVELSSRNSHEFDGAVSMSRNSTSQYHELYEFASQGRTVDLAQLGHRRNGIKGCVLGDHIRTTQHAPACRDQGSAVLIPHPYIVERHPPLQPRAP
jgi:hypothetical protein